MQPTPSIDNEGSVSDILRETEAHYTRAIRALGELVQRVESGELVGKNEAQQTASDLRKAMQTYFDERKKVEEQHRRNTGIVHAFALDFDAARNEIGSRLARLRKHRSAE